MQLSPNFSFIELIDFETLSCGTLQKHKKQLKALGKLVSDTVQVQTKQTVPKGTPKFVDLTSKLIAAEDSGEPVIGVRYLEEIRKENNPEGYEPKYRCTLCAVTCEVDPMYQHVSYSKVIFDIQFQSIASYPFSHEGCWI